MQAIILAAGESSRFWPLNQGHKSQIKLLGKPLAYWTIKGLAENGIKDIAVIISPDSSLKEDLKLVPRDFGVNLSFLVQEKPLGTGNAVSLAKDFIKEPFFLVWGAKAFAKEIIAKALEKYKGRGLSAVFVGAKTDAPWNFGIFKLAGENILEIVEKPEPGKEPSKIKQVGIYLLEPAYFDYYQKISKHHEADNIDILNLYLKDKKTELLLWPSDIPSLKYPWDTLSISRIMLEAEGFENYISPSATIGTNVVIKGKVYIGDNCQIGDNNVLRGPLDLENDVKTGAFFEIKNSVVQEGTHFHSGYVGDSVIGKNCRFGAGFITANRRLDRDNIKSIVKGKKVDTGLTYFGTAVGDDSKFGINISVMPGNLIGSNCQIGPASLVRENIENNTKFYTEFKGIKKEI